MAIEIQHRGSGRLVSLDGLRGYAVLAVFGFHATRYLPGGWAGVDVFFVLSGYLITTLLLVEYQRTSTLRFGAFWARRGIRLLPALVTVILGALAVGWWHAGAEDWRRLWLGAASGLGYFTNFLDTTNIPLLGHLWSLSLEEQFYLTWPLFFFFAMRRGMSRRRLSYGLFAGAIAVSVNVAIQYRLGVTADRLGNLPDTRSTGLLVGCDLAMATFARPAVSPRQQRLIRLSAYVAVGVAPIVLVAGSTGSGFPYDGGYLLISLGTAAILLERRYCSTRMLTLGLEAKWVVWLGVRSYEFYLIHLPLVQLAARAHLPQVSSAPACLALSLILSAAVHTFWQPRQDRWRRQLPERRRGAHRPTTILRPINR